MGKGDPQARAVQAPEENGMSREGLAATETLLALPRVHEIRQKKLIGLV